jgi:hypothetical protein
MHMAESPAIHVGKEESLMPASGNISWLFRERPLRTISREEPDARS